MPVFIELTTDPFDDQFVEKSKNLTAAGAGKDKVRRPLRGLEIKEETYAYIKLIRSDGTEIQLVDSSDPSGYSSSYSNFILQEVQEQRMERHQIVETFGDTYLFLFGESPRFLNVRAVLLNSLDFNWEAEFSHNYEHYLRGTKSIEQGARCYLFYDDNIVEGYILNTTTVKNANDPLHIPLTFQFFVTNARNISLIDNEGSYPIRQTAIVPDDMTLQDSLNGEQVQELVTQTLGPRETAFLRGIQREGPLRSKIADNADEYTSPLQPTFLDLINDQTNQEQAASRRLGQEVDDLPATLSQALSGYGVDPASAYSPFTSQDLGVAPSFLPGGVGVGSAQGQAGAFATFGASASAAASSALGGFAGVRVGASATPFARSSAGVVGSAQAGAFAGASFGVSGTGPQVASSFGSKPSASASAGFSGSSSDALLGAQVGAGSFGFSNITGKVGGQASAFASAQVGARAPGYAASSAQAAAQAGGYAGYGAYMGYDGYGSSVGASFAGQSGSGAGIFVGGKSSAFGFTSVPGTLTNTELPPAQAMAGADKQFAFNQEWSWSPI